MSTATVVPETWELDGDDAMETLRTCGRGRLLVDSWQRLRVADGFSHARSLAYATGLVLVQGLIALVGLASALGKNGVSGVIERSLRSIAPGPAGEFLTRAVEQAHRTGATHRWTALLVGLAGTLVTGCTLAGQVERGLNRIYGVEQDRPTVQKYGLALVLTLTAGVLIAAAFALFAFGRTVGDSIDSSALSTTWSVLRWPLGVVFVTLATTAVFRWSPRRHQPGYSWLAYGAAVSTLGWLVVTIALGWFFSVSSNFGETYGPIAGVVALQVWALLSAVAILYGGAVAAQLESLRAGATEPQDRAKVEHSEPGPARIPAGARVA